MKHFQILYQWYIIGINMLCNCLHKQHIKKAMPFFPLSIFLLDYKQKEFHYTSFASLSLLWVNILGLQQHFIIKILL
jgi:hypothetical protein